MLVFNVFYLCIVVIVVVLVVLLSSQNLRTKTWWWSGLQLKSHWKFQSTEWHSNWGSSTEESEFLFILPWKTGELLLFCVYSCVLFIFPMMCAWIYIYLCWKHLLKKKKKKERSLSLQKGAGSTVQQSAQILPSVTFWKLCAVAVLVEHAVHVLALQCTRHKDPQNNVLLPFFSLE